MSPYQVIVLATPVFLLLIALEFAWSRTRASRTAGQQPYRLNDAINSISLGIISQLFGVLSKVLSIGIYTLVFGAVAIYPDLAFWTTWYGIILALIFYDFCYYWVHRAGHVIALFWAAHVVHHQSQHYNLSTALRQTSSGALFGWIFYIPMAIAGVPPLVFGIVALIDLLYQFWVHTEQVGKLGWFDRVFCSPSNHRVHHAVNDPYIDKNYGGLLVIWDRMFGSFQEEMDHEPCVYGTRGALNSWDPMWANLEVYWALAKDSWATRNWGDKVRIWFKPPGWQPEDLKQAHPKPAFKLENVTTYNPPLTAGQQWFAALQFILALAAVSVFLWNADTMSLGTAALWIAAISASMWALGLFMQGRLALLEVLVLESAALATLSALGMVDLHLVFKPATMAIAIIFVATRAISTGAIGRFDALLLAALVFSLGGDVFLMLPGDQPLWGLPTFILGLGSFLVAHLFYIALFCQGQAWFPSKRALLLVLGVGAAMYAIVWGGLGNDTVLKIAVAAYVTVISLMTAQAIGRAVTLGDSASRWVAVGACVFMVSDSLIAINKFVTPVALSSLWILVTYYCAQMLIVHHSRKA
ncbi:MAG TPA: lysoplasmalogenase family protein [Rhodoferax sp.]|nr:lysoplasmalogenase family protein [Rhodoferax sp.]